MRFTFGGFELDDTAFTLTGPSGRVHVEPQVFALLHHLVVHRDRVVPKEELLDEIWGDRFVSESALTSRIKSARRAVGDDGQAQRVIKTVHSRGYQFVAAVVVDADAEAGLQRRSLPRLRSMPLGRDDDIDSLIGWVADTPLVTVSGPGGIGKTTLALAVADRLQGDFDEGVVFVDLAPVPAGADITRAVAEAAGVEGSAAASVDGVADHLAVRPLLLVLDNCEHVLARAGDLVDRMLDRSGTTRILTTSREPLGVVGEHVWPLGPLYGSGPALFVERARAAEPRVAWDAADPAVVELCRRLDDVPLALELAAGQLRRFDLDELSRRLDDRLALLAGRTADGSMRHATMETAIDWSYQLLDGHEQCLLRYLSVFPSSFDTVAVELCLPADTTRDTVAVFGRLVDKSLVVHLPGTGRYRLLETIRVFAGDRLDEAGEREAAVERHRAYVRQRVGSSSRADRWFSARLAAGYRDELEDARQAFWLSVANGRADDAVEIAIGASFLWRNAMGCTEGGSWLDALSNLELAASDEAWLHLLRADVGQGRGDPRQMFGTASAARALADRTGDLAGACLAAHYEALAHLTDPDHAEVKLAAALDLAERSGDARLVSLIEAFTAVGDLAAGRNDRARETVQRVDRHASDDGYDRFILHWAAWMLALAEFDAPSARRWMDAQQHYLDRTGIVETWITSFSTAMSDVVDGGEVGPMLSHALWLADREGYQADADCLLALAYAELCASRPESAAELVGAAVHSRFNVTANYVIYRAVLDRTLREQLDASTLAAATARGRERSPAEALREYGITRPS